MSSSLSSEASMLRDYWAVKYTGVAFLTILFYDHIITLDEERDKIWGLPWRLPKILFLVIRYVIAPAILFRVLFEKVHVQIRKTCFFMMHWTASVALLAVITVWLMSILRVLALYSLDKKVLVFLVVLSIASVTAAVCVDIHALNEATAIPGGGMFSGCLLGIPSLIYAQWIPLACFESTILVMTVYKALTYRRSIPVLRVLARDSIIYFSTIVSFLMANLFFTRFAKGFLKELWFEPSIVVGCIAVARMTLNIREFSDGKQRPEPDILLSTIKNPTTTVLVTTTTQTETTRSDLGAEDPRHESSDHITEVRLSDVRS